MTRIFENPANGHVEEVGGRASFAVFFLGLIYLIYKGLWAHVFIWFLVVVLPSLFAGPAILIFTLPTTSIGYAIGIQEILANRYLQNGWRDRRLATSPKSRPGNERNAGQQQPTPPRVLGVPTSATQIAVASTKVCPFCAEDIKAAAIRCKHCQADLTATPG